MSKQVDERVVSLEFDNARFEKNVSTSLSTLDKLKQSLNFKGMSDGLGKMSSAIKKVDFSSMESGAESLRARFSALDVVAVTALANIANSAVNTGKTLLKSLTLDPILSGFREYETQMNSVQTILANTQSKGTTIDDVTAALNELNTYADQTIYNFTEMTRNIGTFTAAGVDLDKSVSSIKGISNLAAMSGSSAQQASTAMYQLSQAIAAGRVSLMDWNSVVNAGMGGEVFQNALKRTATQMGYNVDALIEKYGSFRESLTQGQWLTTEVLTETLTQLSGAYTEADLIAQGYTQEQAQEIVKLADTALSAATDVKTFGQLMDTTREAIGSGWAQTWQIVFGDFEESKELFTSMSNVMSGLVNNFSEARNNLLSGALSSKWGAFSEQIEKAGVSTEKFQKALSETASTHGKSLDKMIEEEGSLKKVIDAGLISKEELIETLGKLPDVMSKDGKATEEQTRLLKSLGEQATDTGTEFGQMIEQMGRRTGRELLIESLSNMLQPISTILKSIGSAWRDAFPPMQSSTLYNLIEGLHGFSEAIMISEKDAKNLTDTLRGVFAIVDIVASIFGGGFRLAFQAASTVVSTLFNALGLVNTNLLEVTARVGRAVASFRDWYEEHSLVNKAIEITVTLLVELIKSIIEFGKSVADLPQVSSAIDKLASGFSKIGEAIDNITPQTVIKGLKNLSKSINQAFSSLGGGFGGIPADIMAGLADGIRSGAGDAIAAIAEVGLGLLESIMKVLGIHSPSTEMFSVGENIIAGLLNGIKSGITAIKELILGVGNSTIDVLGAIDWNTAFAVLLSGGIIASLAKLLSILSAVTKPMEGFGAVLSSVANVIDESSKGIGKSFTNFAKVIKGFSKILKAKAFSIRAKAIKDLATSIAILAGSVFLLGQLDTGQLWSAVGAIVVLTAVLAGLAVAIERMSKSAVTINKEGVAIADLKPSLLSISAALLLLAATVKVVGSMDPEEAKQGFIGLTGLVVEMSAFMAVYGKMVKGDAAKNMDRATKFMTKMSLIMFLMTHTLKSVSKMDPGDAKQGLLTLAALEGLMLGMAAISRLGDKATSEFGSTMLKMAVALGLMVAVIKLTSKIPLSEVVQGGVVIGAFTGILLALGLVSQMSNKVSNIGKTLLAMSASMLIMVGVIKLVSGMSPGEIAKGIAAIALFAGVVSGMALVAQLGAGSAKIATSLLAMSASVGILAGVAVLLSLIDIKGLAKGIVAVGLLSTFVSMMTVATKFGKDVKGSLIGISVAIGIMAASVAALSFIDPTKLASATAALSILMGVFALVLKASSAATASIGPLIVMTVAIGVIGTVLAVLAALDAGNSIKIAASLSMLLLAMSAALVIASSFGSMAPMALASLAIVTAVTGVLAAILYALSGMDVNSAIPIATSLSTLLLALSASVAILAVAGLGGPAALFGVAALDALIVSMAGIMIGLGALVTYIPNMETFLNRGLSVLEKVAYGIGSFLGNIAGGFLDGATSGLPGVADNLSTFMDRLSPFLEGASKIDESMMAGIKSLAGALLVLTGADLLNAITSFITGEGSLSEFALQLVPFGEAMTKFAQTTAGVDTEAIANSAKAAAALVKVANAIPNSGGLAGLVMGENDLSMLGDQLIPFGKALVGYANSVAGLNSDAISASIPAAKSLVAVADSISNNIGGWAGTILGDNDLGSLGETLVPFGRALVSYSNAVSSLNVDAITASIPAARAIIKLGDSIENNMGGWAAVLAGDNSLSAVGDELIPFGQSLVTYANAMSNINLEGVSLSISVSERIIRMINRTADIDTSGVSSFIQAIDDLAGANTSGFVATFSVLDKNMTFAGINAVQSLVNGLKTGTGSLTATGRSLVSAFITSVQAASSSAGPSMTSVINSMRSSIDSQRSLFANSANVLMKQFINTIKSNTHAASSAVRSLVANAATTLRGYYSKFYSAGSYLVSGFAAGIDDNAYKAEAKSRVMANAAKRAAEKELDEHSPSKEFYRIASLAVAGFVNAFSDGVPESSKAGKGIATSAISGLTEALNRLDPTVDMDMDWSPVITPVLDLRNVEKQGNRLAAILNGGRTTAIGLDVSERNSAAERRRSVVESDGQNGSANRVEKTVNQTFNQYNTSPKALSRTDLYRQTKNLFAMAKGVNA